MRVGLLGFGAIGQQVADGMQHLLAQETPLSSAKDFEAEITRPLPKLQPEWAEFKKSTPRARRPFEVGMGVTVPEGNPQAIV